MWLGSSWSPSTFNVVQFSRSAKLLLCYSAKDKVRSLIYYAFSDLCQHQIITTLLRTVGKGISSYYANPEGAGTSLQECMIEAKNKIPANRHSETPVYLGATAGMRLLK